MLKLYHNNSFQTKTKESVLETGQFVLFNVDLFGVDDVENYAPWINSSVIISIRLS